MSIIQEQLNIIEDDIDAILPIPNIINTYSEKVQGDILQYVNQLDSHNRKIYSIAYEHLGSSFNILKSNGYIQWSKSRNNPNRISSR